MNAITGRTILCGILGDPIAHVRTPGAINNVLQERGIDGVMVPMHVAPGELAAVVAGLRGMQNFAGFIATLPHKSTMQALCDELSDRARAIGAVKVVRRKSDGTLAGDILDGLCFTEGLRQADIRIDGRSAYLAGAGGAASAIAFALVAGGVSRLTIANRTRARAEALLQRLATLESHADIGISESGGDPSGHDLVVNATSLGLRADDALPLDVSKLEARQVVAEIIMSPETTALLAAAQARGCRVQRGRPKLDCQLRLMADFMGLRATDATQVAAGSATNPAATRS
jgi:shikimate dehydrogenase